MSAKLKIELHLKLKQNIILSFISKYLDGNNLYGWAMSQKPPVNGFKWKKILLSLMKTS